MKTNIDLVLMLIIWDERDGLYRKYCLAYLYCTAVFKISFEKV